MLISVKLPNYYQLLITNNLDQYKVMKNLQKDGTVSTLLHVD